MGNTTPYAVAFLIRFFFSVLQILTKVAFTQGTSTFVLVFYRHVIATILLLPVAFAFKRYANLLLICLDIIQEASILRFTFCRKTAPPLSYKVSLKLFVHALYGMSASMNISFIGLNYASATSASAVQNLLPVLAFFLALLLGMESLNLKRCHGIVTVSGVLICAIGVILLALYQGPELKSFIHHHLFHHTRTIDSHPSRNWILGIFLQCVATLMWALWAVLQGPLLEEYPCKLLNTTVQTIFATIQSFFMALAMERDFSRWKLGLDIGLVTIVYCGVVVSALSYYLQIWVVEKKGGVFLTMTSPITLVITIILSLLIGEPITLGSVISGALMVGGLYNVLWGKRIEQLAISQQGDSNGEKAACSDLEEQERVAPVPARQD